MRALIALGGLLALGGCAMAADMPGDSPVVGAAPGQCPAAANQSLVGTHVGVVMFAPDANVRVVCTTCPTTRDLRPDRMNVRFDQATGIIQTVDCG